MNAPEPLTKEEVDALEQNALRIARSTTDVTMRLNAAADLRAVATIRAARAKRDEWRAKHITLVDVSRAVLQSVERDRDGYLNGQLQLQATVDGLMRSADAMAADLRRIEAERDRWRKCCEDMAPADTVRALIAEREAYRAECRAWRAWADALAAAMEVTGVIGGHAMLAALAQTTTRLRTENEERERKEQKRG